MTERIDPIGSARREVPPVASVRLTPAEREREKREREERRRRRGLGPRPPAGEVAPAPRLDLRA